jgi:nucleoside-diphosphate-sugar epimerase
VTTAKKHATVAGAGGFIGHHLVGYLKDNGYTVRGVDLKQPEYEPTGADEFLVLDLREYDNCRVLTRCTSWRPTWAASGISPPTTRRSRATTF